MRNRPVSRPALVVVPSRGEPDTEPLAATRPVPAVVADPPTEPVAVRAAATGGRAEALALSIGSGLGALAGLVSWLIASRTLPPTEVGRPRPWSPRSCWSPGSRSSTSGWR